MMFIRNVGSIEAAAAAAEEWTPLTTKGGQKQIQCHHLPPELDLVLYLSYMNELNFILHY